MNTYQILQKIKNTSSTNDKIKILEEYKDCQELKTTIKLTLDDTLFYIKKIPIYNQVEVSLTLLQAYTMLLENIVSRKITGHSAIEYVRTILCNLSSDDAKVIEMVIKKDLDCGVQEKTANKVWKKLIKETPYMRCSLDMKNIKYPCIAQTKADGMFVNIIYPGSVENSDVSIISRNGKTVSIPNLEAVLSDNLLGYTVYHGELLVYDEDMKTVLDRKTGNGILNRKIRTEDEERRIFVKLWDCMPVNDWVNGVCKISALERYQRLKTFDLCDRIKIIDTEIVDSLEQAYEFYDRQIKNGEEGAILKNIDSIWKNHTSPNCVKMKEVKECELKVIEVIPHSKDINLIGAIKCVSNDGKLVTDVGSGFTDADRKQCAEYFIDKIVTVKYNEVIKSKNKEEYALFLPRYVEIRHDRNVADNMGRIK